jgi:MoaA/NifB/PqqE/SkfB family radical SAM enzyme
LTDYFKYKIELLEVENSSLCNAACPQCTRQALDSDTSWFEHDFLRVDAFKKIPDSVWEGIKTVSFAGTMGDPCAAPNLIPTLQYIRQRAPHAYFKIETNGGLKVPEFWKRLAQTINGNGHVQFAIDGLEDTNHIYRVNVNWNKLMNNVKAYMENGGDAHWQFIVFRHNEHQVEQAKQLAKDMGFSYINIKKSHRFVFDEMFNMKKLGYGGVPILPPENKIYQHKVILNKKTNVSLNDMINDNFEKCVDCYVKKEKSLYIDNQGRLFPCCFIAGSIYIYQHVTVLDGWTELWENYGKEKICLYNHGWYEILEGEFFDKIEKSWLGKTKEKTIFACISTCVSESSNQVNDPHMFGELDKKIN